ncbi:MAG: hypothetical protein D3903_18615 [Candidatus Electrothrix sp. GM3_4]|nr:hypothetical protein [Candidatus Electrothrix sp. GM3_4]
MLVIRNEQMDVFREDALLRFEDEMMAHSKDFTLRLCEVLGDKQLRVAVHSAIERAKEYGFTNRGPIRLFIEMMFLCGSGFDTDPQYPAFGKILQADDEQMQRAEQIRQIHLDYLEKVSGPDAENVHRALKKLSLMAEQPLEFSEDQFVPGMLEEMDRTFPEKTAYVGDEGLTELIHEGREKAQGYDFSTLRGQVLIVVLMFAFGHGCTDDPLYPWISRTLQDGRITSPAGRAARLEKKALTWLDHVNARNEQRESV